MSLLFRSLALTIGAILALVCTFTQSRAEIVGSGDLSPADPATWTAATDVIIGQTAVGTLTVDGGSELATRSTSLGSGPFSDGTATVTGGATWKIGENTYSSFYIGDAGRGTLSITDGGTVHHYGSPNIFSYIGASPVSTGTVTVEGAGSTWINDSQLWIGSDGNGTLNILDGGAVTSPNGIMAYYGGSTATVNVGGSGSQWIVANEIHIGGKGSGTLNIGYGGGGGLVKAYTLHVSDFGPGICNLDGGATLRAVWIQAGSANAQFNWNDGTIKNYDAANNLYCNLAIRLAATGIHAFDVDAGRQVGAGALSDATTGGTLVKRGEGTLILNGPSTYTGMTTIEAGVLAYSGAAGVASGPYTVIGGIWNIGGASKSIGALRITGGTVNGTGMLTSNADYDIQGGTVNVPLIGNVGLEKSGPGLATLAGGNNYRGPTSVEEGTLTVTGAISGTSGVTIAESATLELANTGSIFAVTNDGTLLVSAGSQNIRTITGSGTTRLGPSTTLTAESIAQDSLEIGYAGAAASNAAENSVTPVPEPSTFSLLVASAIGAVFFAFRRRFTTIRRQICF